MVLPATADSGSRAKFRRLRPDRFLASRRLIGGTWFSTRRIRLRSVRPQAERSVATRVSVPASASTFSAAGRRAAA